LRGGAGMTSAQKVYQALASVLAKAGPETIFTLMSDDTAKLLVELDRQGVRVLGTRHEQAALGAADGFARASGRVGVAILGRGPGLTNAVNALVTAQKAGSRVLVVIGEGPAVHTRFGKDIDQAGLLAALGVAHVPLTSPATAPALLAGAIKWVSAGGPVVVSIPADVLDATAGAEEADTGLTDRQVPGRAAADEIADVAELLSTDWACRHPVILAGAGAVRAGAGEPLRELGSQIGAVLGTTLCARSMFLGDPYDIGIVGTFASPTAVDLLRGADLVLAVGASLNQNTSYGNTLFPSARIVHIDGDPTAFGRYLPAELTVCADALDAVRALVDALKSAGHQATGYRTTAVRNRLALDAPDYRDVSTPGRLDPRTVLLRLDELLPRDRNVVIDPGHHFSFDVPYLRVPEPGAFVAPLEYAAVGSGLGPALGVAVARPDRPTVLAVGDGGFLMYPGDLDTAVRYELPLIVVVLDDGGFGSEIQYLAVNGLPTTLAEYTNPPIADIARGLGATAMRIAELSDLDEVQAFLRDAAGPVVLHCLVSPKVRGDWVDFFYAPARGSEKALGANQS
jgi:acetolactate synthase I/II/III large subunit